MKAKRVDLLLKAGRVESNLTGIRLRGPRREDWEYLDALSRVAGRLEGRGGGKAPRRVGLSTGVLVKAPLAGFPRVRKQPALTKR